MPPDSTTSPAASIAYTEFFDIGEGSEETDSGSIFVFFTLLTGIVAILSAIAIAVRSGGRALPAVVAALAFAWLLYTPVWVGLGESEMLKIGAYLAIASALLLLLASAYAVYASARSSDSPI